MKKVYSAFEENYLVPAVLFLLNVCLAHLLYAFARSSYSATDKILLVLSFVLLGVSLLSKGKMLLSGAIFGYSIIAWYLIAV